MAPRRLAQGCAAVAVLFAFVLPATAGATTTITTVAGGGTQQFGYPVYPGVPATSAALGSPTGISYTFQTGPGYGTENFWVLSQGADPGSASDDPCLLLEDQASTLRVMAGVLNGCDPPNTFYSCGNCSPWTGSAVMRFQHPCCVAPFGRNHGVGALVASSDAGRVEFLFPNSGGYTIAGSTLAHGSGAGCDPSGGQDSPPDNILAATNLTATPYASFCRITAVASVPDLNAGNNSTGNSVFAFGEVARTSSGSQTDRGHVYFVGTDGIVHHVTGSYHVAGLAFTANGDLLIADGLDGIERISGVQSTPSVEVIAGRYFPNTDTYFLGFDGDGQSGSNIYFNHVKAIAVGYDGAVYAADAGNCRIRKLSEATSSGIASTIAGTGCGAGSPPYGDGGPSTSASLNNPSGLAMAPVGLLVSDTGNNRVRLIDRTSIVSGPPAATNDTTPAFEFSSLDTPAHFKCLIDDNPTPFACPSPYTFDTLPDGSHTVQVWEDGPPADPTPATATFTVDTVAPTDLSLVSPAADATEPSQQPNLSWSEAHDATTVVDHYELLIDGVKDSDVPVSACSGGTCTAKPVSPMGETAHTWQVRAFDSAGNSAQTEVRTLNIGGPPSASLLVNPNPALVGRTVTFDGSGSSDPSGITKYEFDLDGDGKFERDTGTTPTTTRSFDAPASVAISLRVTDGTGKTSTTKTTLRITQPGSTANLLGISINSGAQFTNDPNVKLLVKAPVTATSILVSNDGGFLAPSTFPVAQEVDWKLDSSGPERLPKTVYSRFMLGPIISETYTDDIILDEIPPVVQQAALAPTPAAATNAATAAKAKTYVVKVKAKDSNSGVGKVQVTANKKKPGKLLAYKSKVSVKSASKPKWVRARDRAGNFSKWKKLR